MSEREYAHQQWTNSLLGPHLRAAVGQWQYLLEQEIEGVRLTFLHYALASSGSGFAPIIQQATTEELDTLFTGYDSHLIFYGHHHPFSDLQGRARYINPGSLGCYTKAEARYTLVTLQHGHCYIEHRSIPYDDAALFEAFQTRNVPEREFICRTFLSRPGNNGF
jgi:hypothetical protein